MHTCSVVGGPTVSRKLAATGLAATILQALYPPPPKQVPLCLSVNIAVAASMHNCSVVGGPTVFRKLAATALAAALCPPPPK